MDAKKARAKHDQQRRTAPTRQAPDGQAYGRRQPVHASESTPPLHRYLGNSYVQSLAVTERTTQQASALPPIVRAVLHAPGQPLDPTTRTLMESRFDADFSQVRIHTDAQSAESARAVDALAYTVGRDVVFSEGSYTPHLRQGSKLLAHELAHVIQQERGGASPPLRGGVLERHADAAASAFVSGLGFINVSGASAPGLTRQPLERKRRLREMLNLDPAKPQDRQLGDELDLIENLLTMSGIPLNDTAIVEQAIALHKNTEGKVGGAVLAYYDRVVAGAVGGMLAQAAAPVVIKTDPSGKVEVLLRAGELALAHKKLQIDTALNLIEGFAKAGAVAIAGSLAGGLLMLAAAAAPAVFGAYASVSTMSAEAVTALALRLAPRLMAWAASNPYLAEAVVVTVVSTVLDVAETGTVDPMGVVFNLLHLRYTQLQTRTPAPVPSKPPSRPPGPPPPKAAQTIPAKPPAPKPAPTLTVKQGGGQGSGRPTGMLRDIDVPSKSVEVTTASHPVFKGKLPANDPTPGKTSQPQAVELAPTGTGGPVSPAKIVKGSGTPQDPSRLRMATSGGPPSSGPRSPTTGSLQSSRTTATPPVRGAHPRTIPRNELPARRAVGDIEQTQVDVEPLGQQDVRGSVTTSGGSPSQVPNVAQGEISKAEFTRPPTQKPAPPPPARQSAVTGQRTPQGQVRERFDFASLPVPEQHRGAKDKVQVFGTQVINWGAGPNEAQALTTMLQTNPVQARAYIENLRRQGVTGDMARAWAEAYRHEHKRAEIVSRTYRTPMNKTPGSRVTLMELIASLL